MRPPKVQKEGMDMYSKTLSLRFPPNIVNKPIAVKLVKDFDLSFNILKATIYPRKEGLMVLELTGSRKNYQRGIRYLKSLGMKVAPVGQTAVQLPQERHRSPTSCHRG